MIDKIVKASIVLSIVGAIVMTVGMPLRNETMVTAGFLLMGVFATFTLIVIIMVTLRDLIYE
jgi:hypothetical protein